MNLSEAAKTLSDLRKSLEPYLDSMKRIVDIVGEAAGDIGDELSSWENEGGATESSLMRCAHCRHPITENDAVRLDFSGLPFRRYHNACWKVVGK